MLSGGQGGRKTVTRQPCYFHQDRARVILVRAWWETPAIRLVKDSAFGGRLGKKPVVETRGRHLAMGGVDPAVVFELPPILSKISLVCQSLPCVGSPWKMGHLSVADGSRRPVPDSKHSSRMH